MITLNDDLSLSEYQTPIQDGEPIPHVRVMARDTGLYYLCIGGNCGWDLTKDELVKTLPMLARIVATERGKVDHVSPELAAR